MPDLKTAAWYAGITVLVIFVMRKGFLKDVPAVGQYLTF